MAQVKKAKNYCHYISDNDLIKMYERLFGQMKIQFGGSAHKRMIELKNKSYDRYRLK